MKQAQNQMVELAEFEQVCRKRDALQQELKLAGEIKEKLVAQRDNFQVQLSAIESANEALQKEAKQLRARIAEAHVQFERRVWELAAERDVARQEADYLRKRGQEAEERVVQFQEQIKVQEEVIERLKAQNCRFVEEQREAKQRAASLAADNARAREEVARLVKLADAFKAQNDHLAARLAKVTQEKNQIRAEYDARGKVIKKLRKRLHKLKKKLKH